MINVIVIYHFNTVRYICQLLRLLHLPYSITDTFQDASLKVCELYAQNLLNSQLSYSEPVFKIFFFFFIEKNLLFGNAYFVS